MSGKQLAMPARRVSRRQPLRIDGACRVRLAALAENIIALLDELDGDSDFEPALGALANGDQSRWGSSDTRDREPNGDELDYSDGDPFGLRSLQGRQG